MKDVGIMMEINKHVMQIVLVLGIKMMQINILGVGLKL